MSDRFDLERVLEQLREDIDALLERDREPDQQQQVLEALWSLPPVDPEWLPEADA